MTLPQVLILLIHGASLRDVIAYASHLSLNPSPLNCYFEELREMWMSDQIAHVEVTRQNSGADGSSCVKGMAVAMVALEKEVRRRSADKEVTQAVVKTIAGALSLSPLRPQRNSKSMAQFDANDYKLSNIGVEHLQGILDGLMRRSIPM